MRKKLIVRWVDGTFGEWTQTVSHTEATKVLKQLQSDEFIVWKDTAGREYVVRSGEVRAIVLATAS